MTDHLKQRIREGWDSAWNQGDLTAVDELMTPDYVRCARDRDPLDREQFKDMIVTVRRAFPDLLLVPEDMIREDDRVVTKWRVQGTHCGIFYGAPPTNELVTIGGLTLSTFRGDQIVSDWLTWDAEDMIGFLGIISIGRYRETA